MPAYFGVITKDSDSEYSIAFTDLGCYSAAGTLGELEGMAREALKGHLDILEEEGMEIPQPSSFQQLYEENKSEEGFLAITLVSVPEKVTRHRVNLSLTNLELDIIDNAAAARSMGRSEFLVSAAKAVASGEHCST